MITRLTGSLIALSAIAFLLSGYQVWKLAHMIQKRINVREFLAP
ncbi:hypothetical protein [Spirosoma sp. KCTC 42546]|nr:hypothetical protein [Spirosoma sp. KCTC 42546]